MVKESNAKYFVFLSWKEYAKPTQITELLKYSQTETALSGKLISLLQKWVFLLEHLSTTTSGQPVLINTLLLNTKTVLLC